MHGSGTLAQLQLEHSCPHLGEQILADAWTLENVQEALVASGDEYFLSLSIDSMTTIRKQPCFFRVGRDVSVQFPVAVAYRNDGPADLMVIRQYSGDFFDDGLGRQVADGEVFIGLEKETPLSFRVYERGRLLRDHVRTGLYTRPEYRRRSDLHNQVSAGIIRVRMNRPTRCAAGSMLRIISSGVQSQFDWD